MNNPNKEKTISVTLDALDRKHWIKLAEQDTEGFEDPIDYIQLIASLYERMNKLGGFDN